MTELIRRNPVDPDWIRAEDTAAVSVRSVLRREGHALVGGSTAGMLVRNGVLAVGALLVAGSVLGAVIVLGPPADAAGTAPVRTEQQSAPPVGPPPIVAGSTAAAPDQLGR